MKYLEQVAAVKLTGAKLMRAHELVDEQRADEVAVGEVPDFTSLMIALVRAVPNEFSRDEVPAIIFRMQAFAALVKGDLSGWAFEDETNPGAWFVNEAALEAAATATLDLDGEMPAFSPDEFKELALKAARPEGCA